jgi:hypothetical protein
MTEKNIVTPDQILYQDPVSTVIRDTRRLPNIINTFLDKCFPKTEKRYLLGLYTPWTKDGISLPIFVRRFSTIKDVSNKTEEATMDE